ncbi:hypothetical protein TrCOL_g13831 [Triparma columacea]|uniref:Cysteinyl-tRNA ligase anticodon binding domain-containing protein n=1 Tax=Triparma columacea TaxID=722753 RepID=A0A9W7L5R1_9STRA|nr:hypothetical protein TrCOL_g13831 [Triparma columacea]
MKFLLGTLCLSLAANSANAFFLSSVAFRPNSFLHESSGYDCLSPMPEQETFEAIEGLLIERSDARYARDYDRADEIRDQLKFNYNVAVYDKDNAWEIVERGQRGGGRGRNQYDRPQRQFDFGPTGHDYVRNEKDESVLSDEKIEEIDALLAERLQAKLTRKFDIADGIQIRLEEEFDVVVHDGYKEWRGDGSDFAYKTAYERAGRDMSPIDEDAVQELIRKRAVARKARNYDEADSLKGELLSNFNVVVNDGRRTWEIRGEQTPREQKAWTRGDTPGPDEAADFESQVQALVEEREAFRMVRDYDSGDAILDRLNSEFGVSLSNRDRIWAVGSYVVPYKRDENCVPGEDEDEDFESTVQAIVEERAAAKAKRDWDTADDLRDELKKDFNVYVDDKRVVWRIDTGPPPRRGGYGGGGRGGGGHFGGGGGGGRGRY